MTSAREFVDNYLAADSAGRADLNRIVTEPTGLADGADILAVISDQRLGPQVLHALSDLMHPTDSMYFDAIYGAEYGQQAIRNWLIPVMAQISFIEFEAQAPTEVFRDESGTVTSSVDEWQMFANLDGDRIPLPRGTSVRHYRDGWITWNADVYDTGAFRTPPPGGEAPDLPDPPNTEWTSRPMTVPVLSPQAEKWVVSSDSVPARGELAHQDLHDVIHHPIHGQDADLIVALMHPTDVRYVDPLFGDFHGSDSIRARLSAVIPMLGRLRFDAIGPVLFNGSCSVQEWMQMAVGEDGSTLPMMRGTSIRRYAKGSVVYAADYFDTAVIGSPAMIEGARLAGSTLTSADIADHRA